MARRLAFVLVIAVMAAIAPSAPAAAETIVTTHGNIIRITMTVDVVGASGKTSPDGTMSLIEYWQGILNNTWGDAFNRLPYKNCYKLELKVTLKERRDSFDSKEGNHRILVGAPTGGLSFEGTGFNGESETTSNPKTGDGTRSFEHDRDGAVPVDAPPTVVAHEFGHLMGLGDDRKNGQPKPGRSNTMMVGGVPGVDVNVVQTIDQNLVDRIAKAATNHLENLGKKLPKCETWSGTVQSTNVGAACTGAENGTVMLAVVGSKATGSIEASGSYTCAGITVPTAGGIQLAGSFEDGDFDLTLPPEGGGLTGGSLATTACWVDQHVRIQTEGDAGSGQATYTAPSGDVYSCMYEIARQPDQDEPVG